MSTRTNIYYWKCDRPSAFFAIKEGNGGNTNDIEKGIWALLVEYFGDENFSVKPAKGQGNHLTFLVMRDGKQYFVRIENGPENDDYMEVEATIMKQVRSLGIPSPIIYAVDSSRKKHPFAWEIMENINYPDLNKIYKSGNLQLETIMFELGTYLAKWQDLPVEGYGPFNSEILRTEGRLKGLLPTYREYYMLNMEKHLGLLVEHSFLTKEKANNITKAVATNSHYLDISCGCLVHKDLALWNVLGTENKIKAIIDWDDSVSGDPTDDLSLMACFHSGQEMNALIRGYQHVKPLPEDFMPRFWLHLMRNMLFKAVIRVGAGYFKKGDSFFLINSESGSGKALSDFTLNRLMMAYEGLTENKSIEEL